MEQAGDVRCAAEVVRAGHPIEQPHHTFDNRQVTIAGVSDEEIADSCFAQHPGVQVMARPTSSLGEQRWVNVIWADLERRNPQAACSQSCDQAGRYGCLAVAAGGRGDDHARGQVACAQRNPHGSTPASQ
jgi:hypothetical protein